MRWRQIEAIHLRQLQGTRAPEVHRNRWCRTGGLLEASAPWGFTVRTRAILSSSLSCPWCWPQNRVPGTDCRAGRGSPSKHSWGSTR